MGISSASKKIKSIKFAGYVYTSTVAPCVRGKRVADVESLVIRSRKQVIELKFESDSVIKAARVLKVEFSDAYQSQPANKQTRSLRAELVHDVDLRLSTVARSDPGPEW